MGSQKGAIGVFSIAKGNISKRTIIIFTFIFLVVIFMTTVFSYMSSTRRLKHELNYSNIMLLKHISKNVDMQLQEIDRQIVSLINEPEIRIFMYENYDNNPDYYVHMQKLLKKMNDLKFTNPNIYSIYLYSSSQEKILTDIMSFKIDEFYDKGWLRTLNDLKKYYFWMDTRSIAENFSNKIERKNIITLVRPYPIASHPQNRDGAVIVNINENVFNNLINGSERQRLGEIFVVGNGGAVLSHYNKNRLYNQLDKEEWGNHILSSNQDGQVNGKMEGIDSSFFYITSPYTGWKYVSVIPHIQINEPIITIRNIFFLIAVCMFLVAVIMVIIASRWAYKPILRFIHTVNKTINESQIADGRTQSLNSFEELEQVFSELITDYDRARKQIEESVPAIKSKLITDILMGYITNYQDVARHLKLLNISLNPTNFIVMVAEVDEWSSLSKNLELEELYYYIRRINSIIEEIVNENFKGAAVDFNEKELAILVSFEGDNSTFAVDVSIALAHKIQKQVQEELRLTISVGIGSFYYDIANVKKSFHEAKEALKYKILMGHNSVICIDDILLYNERELYGLFSSINSIALAIKMADMQEVDIRLTKLFDEVIEKSLPPDFIKQLGVQLVIEGIQAALDTGLDMGNILDGDSHNVYQMLRFCETVDQIKEYIEELFMKFTERIREKRSNSNNSELIEKILEYIQEHYAQNDLSLNRLAEKFHISVPYLSKIFEEHVETNFMDFLIKVRIEKAMELLANSNIKINEVAQEVGYTNSHSFIRAFKKYVGKTPGEFRNGMVLRSSDEDKKITLT